jgi:hypothetical protein
VNRDNIVAVRAVATIEQATTMSKRPKPKPQSRSARQLKKIAIWIAALSVAAAFIYVVSENAGVPYDERAIAVVDFSPLDSKAKKTVLQAANRARCSCTCGLQLAQCVATDSSCPIRTENIEKIKTMVRQAMPRS